MLFKKLELNIDGNVYVTRKKKKTTPTFNPWWIRHIGGMKDSTVEKNYEKISLDNLFSDYKTALQEITQARFGVTPEYKLESESGPDHQKEFELSIWINGTKYATAKGKSKKLAQQASAKIVLEKLTGKKQ